MRWFANDFHSWLRHSWKSLANHLTRDQKIVIHGNSCIILYIPHGNNSPCWIIILQPLQIWSPKAYAFNSLFILTLLFSQSVNGLLADGTKPLPEPIMMYNQWVHVFFVWVQFYRNASAIVTIYWNMFGNHILYVTARSPWLATRLTQFPKKIFVFWLKWH